MNWDINTIKQLILEAENVGYSGAKCTSPREAQLFRKAILNARKNKLLGLNIITKVNGLEVSLRRKPEVKLLRRNVA